MSSKFALTRAVSPARWARVAGLFALVAGIAGCAVVPGQTSHGMREQSAVKLPVKDGDEMVPANVTVQEISADLLIEQVRAQRPQTAPVAAPPPGYDDYVLGPGDVINVIVWEHPELTIPAGEFRSAESSGTVVGEDGNIFYPYVGIVHVDGMTLAELRNELIRKLSKWIENVQLDVRVAAYRSKRVYVVGEINNPGLQPVNDIPLTVIEAINRAGGLTNEADHSNITLTRDGVTYRVDLQALYEDGLVSQNVLLQHGDILNVPDRRFNKVFILGEVRQPGSYLMDKRRKTLAELISDSGDLDKVTANPNQIYVMRGSTDKPEIYHLDSRTPDALLLADQFPLQPRDIVYVDAADSARWNRVITNILPSFTLMNTASGTDFPLFGGRQRP